MPDFDELQAAYAADPLETLMDVIAVEARKRGYVACTVASLTNQTAEISIARHPMPPNRPTCPTCAQNGWNQL